MRLADLRFDSVAMDKENAEALAMTWYPVLTGSVDSRMEQIEARRVLAAAIYHLMHGPKGRRTMADVHDWVAAQAKHTSGGRHLGHVSVELNVTDARSAGMHAEWRRVCARGCQ